MAQQKSNLVNIRHSILYFVDNNTQFSLSDLWVCFKVFSASSTAQLNMICSVLEARKGFKIDNWGFFSHQKILIWHRTNTASCMQCMGPVRDTAERKRHDQTANYSNQVVVFKVPASISVIFGSCTGWCWWCLVQLPWKAIWWRRQPWPMIWCDKLNTAEHALRSSGWKAGRRRRCSTKLTSFSLGRGRHRGQAALVPGELPPTAGLAAWPCPRRELWLAEPCRPQIIPYHGSAQRRYAGKKSQARLGPSLVRELCY